MSVAQAVVEDDTTSKRRTVFSLKKFLNRRAQAAYDHSQVLNSPAEMIEALLALDEYNEHRLAECLGVTDKALHHLRLGICRRPVECIAKRLRELYIAVFLADRLAS